MRIPFATIAALALVTALPAAAAMQQTGRVPDPKVKDVWKPAKTPPGGTSWMLLEKTKLNDRTDKKTGVIFTKPIFPAEVKALDGKRIKIAGWMMPLENGKTQKRWVMLGYPPGCPFHMHALPNQFIEILSPAGVPVNETKVHIMSGTLKLTGQNESGIFYQLVNARPS
ncbi:MAG: DUF3299 domain-containing protein [Sphingorhabdus sp.]